MSSPTHQPTPGLTTPTAELRTVAVQLSTSHRSPSNNTSANANATRNSNANTDTNTAANANDNLIAGTDATPATAPTQWPTDTGANVWLTFPPFPKPPPGVEITPFKDFKPLGIRFAQDPDSNLNSDANPATGDERYVERDGLGIPTVTLRVHHDFTAMEKRKRKNRSRVGGVLVKQVWYDEWAETENLRRLSALLDPSLPRVDRLHQAVYDFKNGRQLQQNQELSHLWDRFRMFIGLISSVQPPAARKKFPNNQEEQVSDDDDEDEMPNAGPPKQRTIAVVHGEHPSSGARNLSTPQTGAPQSTLTNEQRQQRREYYREVRDTKTDRFLNDPEKCVKIFLSGYYRDRGMSFSEKLCRDGPILLGFFLNFCLRNRVFPEMEKMLKKAVAVTELARVELPHTFVISKAIPDGFSKGCEILFGSMTHTTWWAHEGERSAEDSEDGREAKRQKFEDAKGAADAAALLQAAAGTEEIEVITDDVIMSMEQDMKDLVADANVNGAQDTLPTAATTNADDDTPVWGEPAAPLNWAAPDSLDDWGVGPTESPLAKHVGLTTFPLTHTTGIVERSTRRIKSVTMPPAPPTQQRKKSKRPVGHAPPPDAEGVEHALAAAFAKMTLVPWHEWDLYDKADVQKPRLLRDSRGAAVTDDVEGAEVTARLEGYAGAPHNPFKDEITVLLEPSTAEKMTVGMGIEATWVQLARVDPGVPIEVDPETINNVWMQRQKKVVGGPGVPVAPTKMWYMEQVLAVHPSFHTEMIPLPTTDDVFGTETP